MRVMSTHLTYINLFKGTKLRIATHLNCTLILCKIGHTMTFFRVEIFW